MLEYFFILVPQFLLYMCCLTALDKKCTCASASLPFSHRFYLFHPPSLFFIFQSYSVNSYPSTTGCHLDSMPTKISVVIGVTVSASALIHQISLNEGVYTPSRRGHATSTTINFFQCYYFRNTFYRQYWHARVRTWAMLLYLVTLKNFDVCTVTIVCPLL